MDTRPLLIFELHVEYLTVKESFDLNTFLEDSLNVLFEYERGSVDVLILDQISNNEVNRPYLVVP
jgi:hypothetical protein